LAHNSTLAPREVFFPRTRRGKNDLILFAACGRQTLAEGFFAMNSEACYKFAAGGARPM
jgi:hypothetical protein